MVLEYAFMKLVEKIGRKELMDVGSGKIGRKWLVGLKLKNECILNPFRMYLQ